MFRFIFFEPSSWVANWKLEVSSLYLFESSQFASSHGPYSYVKALNNGKMKEKIIDVKFCSQILSWLIRSVWHRYVHCKTKIRSWSLQFFSIFVGIFRSTISVLLYIFVIFISLFIHQKLAKELDLDIDSCLPMNNVLSPQIVNGNIYYSRQSLMRLLLSR